jgi:iron complex outermembrane receptor protein
MNLSKNVLNSHHVVGIETADVAVFGQATYTFMDRLHLTVGLRLDNQSAEGNYHNRANNVTIDSEINSTEMLPKASLSYDLTRDDMIYATVAKGFLAGGFNWCMNPTQNTFNYDPEYTWNYEAGLKTNWFDNKMMVNMSLFYITIDDKQVSVVEQDTRLNTIINAAKAYSYGLEIELKAKPIAELELFANFGYNQAKFDEFVSTAWNSSYTAVVAEDLAGNYLPYAPEYTYTAGAQYRAANGLMARIDLFGTGYHYGDAANNSEQEAYQLVNLRLGYERDNWDAYFWVKNLFDKEYMTWFQPSGSNLYAMDGPPRTIGITVQYRF